MQCLLWFIWHNGKTLLPITHSNSKALLPPANNNSKTLLPSSCQFLKLPITPAILKCIKKAWEAEGPDEDKVMLWAAMLLCFFRFFCSDEICSPLMELFDINTYLLQMYHLTAWQTPATLCNLKQSNIWKKGTGVHWENWGRGSALSSGSCFGSDGEERKDRWSPIPFLRWVTFNSAAFCDCPAKDPLHHRRRSLKSQLSIRCSNYCGSAGHW